MPIIISTTLAASGSAPAGYTEVASSMSVRQRSVSEAAPEGISFDLNTANFTAPTPTIRTLPSIGTTTHDTRLEQLYIFWDYGDAFTFSNPVKNVSEHMAGGESTGLIGSHVYRSAGTYTVTATIYEPASLKWSQCTLDVTVGNPDTLFSGASTYFVDTTYTGTDGATSGTWSGSEPTNVPTGAALYATFDAAYNAMKGGDESIEKRLMLQRGQSHTPTSLGAVGYSFEMGTHCIVAASGAGAKPIVNMTSSQFTWAYTVFPGSRGQRDFWTQNIDYRSDWDTLDMTGSQLNAFTFNEYNPEQVLFDQCDFSGFNISVYMNASPSTYVNEIPSCFVHDCSATEWRSTVVFGNHMTPYVTGCLVAANPDGWSGYFVDAGDPNQALISPFRYENTDAVIMMYNDIFQNTSWDDADGDGYFNIQASMRLQSKSTEGCTIQVVGNNCECGVSVISITNSNGGEDGLFLNCLIEKNILTGNFQTRRVVDTSYGGVTLRNNIGIIPDSDRSGTGGGLGNPFQFVETLRDGSNAANLAAPIKSYNNNWVNLLTDANSDGGASTSIATLSNTGAYSNVDDDSNINYQPGQGLTSDGPLVTTALWVPRLTQYSDYNTASDTSVATPTDTISLYRITSGSGAYEDATSGEVALDDFFSTVRGGAPSRGALELA